MAFFELNGVPFPAPQRGLEFVLSTAVNSGRNAENQVIGERVGRDTLKYNNLVWPWLPEATWRSICKIFDESFTTKAKVWHPAKGQFVTIIIYPGDRSAQPYWLNENDKSPAYYTDCKVNIIDTNQTDL